MELAELGFVGPLSHNCAIGGCSIKHTETYSMYHRDMDQEKVGRFGAVPSHLGPGEVLYDGTWRAAKTLL